MDRLKWDIAPPIDELTKHSKQAWCLPKYAETRNNLVSLLNFLSLIEKLILQLKPNLICEIGVDDAKSTLVWSDLCSVIGAQYHAVDPTISVEVETQIPKTVDIYKESSLTYLNRCFSPDVYFIDGDHNYYTVSNELKLINQNRIEDQFVLVFLDDVGWPFAKRDMYYDPSSIPDKYIKKSAKELKLSPANTKQEEYGLPMGDLYVANTEGGDNNGVLKAVEDFLSLNIDWNFIKLPSIYGFGILWPNNVVPESVRQELESMARSFEYFYSFLGILEFNRINLLTKINQIDVLYREQLDMANNFAEVLKKGTAQAQKDKDTLHEYSTDLFDAIKSIEKDKEILQNYTEELKQANNQLRADKSIAESELALLKQKR